MIKRIIDGLLQNRIGKGKAIILMGARQVGKTTVLKRIFDGNDDVLWLNADE